jgi:hypothetical protein
LPSLSPDKLGSLILQGITKPLTDAFHGGLSALLPQHLQTSQTGLADTTDTASPYLPISPQAPVLAKRWASSAYACITETLFSFKCNLHCVIALNVVPNDFPCLRAGDATLPDDSQVNSPTLTFPLFYKYHENTNVSFKKALYGQHIPHVLCGSTQAFSFPI